MSKFAQEEYTPERGSYGQQGGGSAVQACNRARVHAHSPVQPCSAADGARTLWRFGVLVLMKVLMRMSTLRHQYSYS